jgi:hypothetical protein
MDENQSGGWELTVLSIFLHFGGHFHNLKASPSEAWKEV